MNASRAGAPADAGVGAALQGPADGGSSAGAGDGPGPSPSLLAQQRLMMAELGLAANRRAQLEDKSIRPRALVQALTATRREDFLRAVSSDPNLPAQDVRLHHIEKFKLKPALATEAGPRTRVSGELAAGSGSNPLLATARPLGELALQLPPRDAPHTLDVQKYLQNRVSQVALDKIRRDGAEFFLGSPAQLQAWCAENGWAQRGALGSPSATEFLLLQRGGEDRIMITNIVSHTRLRHQVLQLHFAGVDSAQLALRGDLDASIAASVQRLSGLLGELPPAERRICFFGARRQVTQQLQQALADADAQGRSFGSLSDAGTRSVDSFAFDHMRLHMPDGRSTQFIALRMPHGDLAGKAVQALLAHGVDTLVMCGAGGALNDRCAVGDYLQISSSSTGRAAQPVPADRLIESPGLVTAQRGVANLAVSSPLEETQAWLAQAQAQADCVDVESAHVLGAFNRFIEDHPDATARLVPGLFISDVVGQHPLEEKISSSGAYAQLGSFVVGVLDSLGLGPAADTVQANRPPAL